jgi:hypothetical protein
LVVHETSEEELPVEEAGREHRLFVGQKWAKGLGQWPTIAVFGTPEIVAAELVESEFAMFAALTSTEGKKFDSKP